jgi:hypothetical protein
VIWAGARSDICKKTYSLVVTEEINAAPGCKLVSQAQDEVFVKENLPPSQAILLMDECFQARHRTSSHFKSIKGLIATI